MYMTGKLIFFHLRFNLHFIHCTLSTVNEKYMIELGLNVSLFH